MDANRAREIGESVRATIQALNLPHRTSLHLCVTVSIGVAATAPNDSQRPGDLIEAADAALYAAKHRGRNTVVEHGFVRSGDGGDGIAMAV
jgi:diguanylate cyclase (GGDEF)-like protein